MENNQHNVLQVNNLTVRFPVGEEKLFGNQTKYIYAVNGISFYIEKGSAFGLVGESGCGKSTIARTIVRLNDPISGNVFFENNDLTKISDKKLLTLRRDIQMIFQDPYASLNPKMTVGSIVSEPLRILKSQKIIDITNLEIEERVSKLLDQVGLRASMKKRFPHEFSGGQRQRIGIARAIATYPKLIIADEPVSALDVSIQAQILNLLKSLQSELGLTYLFIAHDLAVVNYMCDKIGVMYLGNLVEISSSDLLNETPLHPYTKMLLDAILVPDPTLATQKNHKSVQGEIEQLGEDYKGCPFYKRCLFRMDQCKENNPPLKEINPGHQVACFLY